MKQRANILGIQNVTIVALNALDFSDYKDNQIFQSFIGLLCSDIKGTGKSVLGFHI